ARKLGTAALPAIRSYSLPVLIKDVNSNSIQSKWIQAKAQVSLDGGGFFSSGTMNLRSFKDSLLWISITKLGMEIGRGLIRSDSAFITNDWEKTYWRGSLQEIGIKYNVPAGLTDIQSLVFPSLQPTHEYLLEKKDPGYTLTEQGFPSKKYSITTIPSPLIQSIVLSTGDADLKVNYEDYQDQKDFWFPFTHNHQFKKGLVLHETKIKFNQVQSSDAALNTPFNIPTDYTLIK
ncbi:MAG: DUF4292 domain-containing protein, partial [Saprospiraceae bacterium]